ncbi:hypothetical protein ACFWA4_05895 [Streptomyces sp. NPDC060011]|uniref:hypothetical protein n=1 Tax=Streptomyces sp. NPDC060011 TaxID=3347037 RepID=UPI0036B2349B
MAKEHGLGAALLVGGVNLSGDIQQVDNISCPVNALDVTGIDKTAHERILGIRDGAISMTTFFNTSTGRSHPTLKTLPAADVAVSYLHRQTIGSPAANLIAKQINYDGSRGSDAGFTFSVQAQGNSYGLEWGELLTAGLRTDTGATSGTGVSAVSGTNYLSLPGTTGHYASTPDAAALDITGDIDVRARISMDDWTPATDTAIVGKYNTTGNQRSYLLSVLTTGALNFQWSEDGTVQKTKTSSIATGFTDGTAHWIRATLDVDNGASNADVKFYTSEDGTTWTQLGTTQQNGATTSIFSGSAILELGSRSAGTAANMAGKFFSAQVLNGLDGTVVASPVAGTSSITDTTGKTWTVNGANSFISFATLYGAQAYLQCSAFTGADVTIKLQQSGDNGVLDTWTDISGGGFTTVTTGPTTERIAISSAFPLERYVRAVTTTSGGFTSASFAVNLVRNEATVTF